MGCLKNLLLGAVPLFSGWLPQALSAGGFLPPPLCAGSGGMPVMLGEALGFCGIKGLSCCDAVDDAELRDEFLAMNTTAVDSNTACTKAKMCSKCDPFYPGSSTSTNPPPPCASTPPPPPSPSSASHAASDAVCLERIAEGSFVSMEANPDGSNRVFLSTKEGKIWLASLHDAAHGARRMSFDGNGVAPFLDLTDRVLHDGVLGLKGIAFHPDFATNGRFFVSYNCDSASPACGAGTCSVCTPEQGCDPEELAAGGNGYRPCQNQLVVAEFSAKGSSEAGARADSSEVRRIFTMGLPQQPHTPYSYQQRDGQILFGPSDGKLYLITGNGGDKAHGQFDFSENKRSLLGKIIRFDIDGMAGAASKPEIVATGVGNPRGCSYDSEGPSYFYCAGVDQEQYEQVYLISDKLPKAVVISHGRQGSGGRPSIIGGLVYRGFTDPTLKARYLYMHGFAMWTGMESPSSSGHYASGRFPTMMCSRNTPLPCNEGIGRRVLSFGEDNSKDAFILSMDGVYRVVGHGLCSGSDVPPPQHRGKDGLVWLLSSGITSVVIALYLVYTIYFGGEGCGSRENRIEIVNNINNFAHGPGGADINNFAHGPGGANDG